MTDEEKDRQSTMDNAIMLMARMCRMCLDIGRTCAAIGSFLAMEYGTGGEDAFLALLDKELDTDGKAKSKDPFKDMKDFKTELN